MNDLGLTKAGYLFSSKADSIAQVGEMLIDNN
jgi:hypothetical protein